MESIAIVDIDNTLWDFCSVLHGYLWGINKNIPYVKDWNEWEFYKPYMTSKEFYACVQLIHDRQEEYGAYVGASALLDSLKMLGYKIIVASHRHVHTKETTEKFLTKNSLYFDDLHLSFDKSVLFKDAKIVIDDHPKLIEAAVAEGVFTTGLLFPWNQHLRTKAKLFKDLQHVERCVRIETYTGGIK